MKWFVKFLPFAVAIVVATCVAAGPVAAQPAPGLTEMRVVGVASPLFANGNIWDTNIPAGAVVTPNNHGGAWLQVAVFERGYANGQVGSFGGARMQLYRSDPQVGPDRKVYGWIRYYYIATPFNNGWFGSSASSIAAPWGTKSTGINIK